LALSPSEILDRSYSSSRPSTAAPASISDKKEAPSPEKSPESTPGASDDEVVLIHKDTPRSVADAVAIPELEVELERARWQVETALQAAAAEAKKGGETPGQEGGEKKSP